MVLGYEVLEDGTLNEVELSKDELTSTIVVCVIDSEYGFQFKVRSIDEGEEPPTFFTALDGTTSATRVLKPGEKAPPPAPPKPKKDPVAGAPSTPPPTPKPRTETVTTPKTTAPSPKPPVPKPSPAPTAAYRTSAPVTAAPQGIVDDMIKELETIDPPEGYQRELVIVYNDLYTVAEHKTSVFGQEKIERRIEKVKDPPEGTFMAEGFIPRVIVKDGRVLGIELLKGSPDAILSPIKSEMKERLSDLITFFKSETDEPKAAPKKSKGKGKKGKKLVAK